MLIFAGEYESCERNSFNSDMLTHGEAFILSFLFYISSVCVIFWQQHNNHFGRQKKRKRSRKCVCSYEEFYLVRDDGKNVCKKKERNFISLWHWVVKAHIINQSNNTKDFLRGIGIWVREIKESCKDCLECRFWFKGSDWACLL